MVMRWPRHGTAFDAQRHRGPKSLVALALRSAIHDAGTRADERWVPRRDGADGDDTSPPFARACNGSIERCVRTRKERMRWTRSAEDVRLAVAA